VFIGVAVESSVTVRERSGSGPDRTADSDVYPERLCRFAVERFFKGAEKADIEVRTGMGGGDCGYSFKIGERYLVYANVVSPTGRLYTSICSRTKAVAGASEDLDYLFGLPDSASKTRISGRVLRQSDEVDEDGFRDWIPMPGLRVELVGAGKHFEVVTSAEGVYQATALPPGKYKVEPFLPSNLAPKSQEVELAPGGCATTDFVTSSNGRVGGRVIDSHGGIVPNATVDLVPADTQGKNDRQIQRLSTRARVDKEGTYQFKELLPGRYHLGINLRDEPRSDFPFSRTYYPGVSEKDKATVLVIRDGENLTGYDLVLPTAIPTRQIEGIFVWSDGRPVTKGRISLTDSDDRVFRTIYASTAVDQRGHFSLLAFEGTDCWVHASTYYTDDRMHWVEPQPFKITVNASIQPLKVIAPRPKESGEADSGKARKPPAIQR
jgi:hypothetical protein